MKIYFLSDAHLGYPNYEDSLVREKKIVAWLDFVSKDADEIWLLGDIFEFWFEWKYVVPKGYIRLLAKIIELSEKGLPIHFYTGNHDLWIFDYLPKETGITLHRNPVTKIYDNKKFYIAHGDGLGPYDKKYNFLKKLFTNRFLQKVLALFHPDLTMKVAFGWANSSKKYSKPSLTYFGDDKEWLVLYSKTVLEREHFDYFVYGHRHLPHNVELAENSRCINLGEWVNLFTYGVFDGTDMKLKKFSNGKGDRLEVIGKR